MHLNAEQIERVLHQELESTQEAVLNAHVRECAYCAQRLDQARSEEREIFALLRRLDHSPPAISHEALLRRASATPWRWGRIAAGLLLLVSVAGGLLALPHSPLLSLLRNDDRVAPADRSGGAMNAPPISGVAVAPGGRLDIVFAHTQGQGIAIVRLVDAREVAVRAIGEPVAFEVDVGRLRVGNQGSRADYEILLPRDAPRVRVEIAGSVVLNKVDERIDALVQPDLSGAYHIPMDSTARARRMP